MLPALILLNKTVLGHRHVAYVFQLRRTEDVLSQATQTHSTYRGRIVGCVYYAGARGIFAQINVRSL